MRIYSCVYDIIFAISLSIVLIAIVCSHLILKIIFFSLIIFLALPVLKHYFSSKLITTSKKYPKDIDLIAKILMENDFQEVFKNDDLLILTKDYKTIIFDKKAAILLCCDLQNDLSGISSSYKQFLQLI